MKSILTYINESNINDLYNPSNLKELKESIKKLNYKEWYKINTSKITDMSDLFYKYIGKFGDISKWDVSNVRNMPGMFGFSSFNKDISNWDVSNVRNMSGMFGFSSFNKDISKWDVRADANVTDIFYRCPLENNPPKWYNKIKNFLL